MSNSESARKETKTHFISNEELSPEKWVINRVNKAIEKFDREKRLEQFRKRKEDYLVEELSPDIAQKRRQGLCNTI